MKIRVNNNDRKVWCGWPKGPSHGVSCGWLPTKAKKAMLHQSKLIYIYVSIAMLIHISCNNNTKNQNINKNYSKIEKEILLKTDDIFRKNILNSLNDSISNWIKNEIQFYKFDSTLAEHKIDSLICINSKSNKIIFVSLGRSLKVDYKLDGITIKYGVKINEKWYFFDGSIIYIPRENTLIPTSFEKLHEIAMDGVFSGYLIENKKTGEWEINERFFDQVANKNPHNQGYGPCFTCKTENEYYLYLVAENWKHKDTTNYERLRNEEMMLEKEKKKEKYF